jgi:hypothetical protein
MDDPVHWHSLIALSMIPFLNSGRWKPENKPEDWPAGLHFTDPNNKGSNGKKPEKAVLEMMCWFLMKKLVMVCCITLQFEIMPLQSFIFRNWGPLHLYTVRVV